MDGSGDSIEIHRGQSQEIDNFDTPTTLLLSLLHKRYHGTELGFHKL